jgi:hypothetical protein
MPLLNIVGSTCTNKTFYVFFCFMADETEESYRWALTQLHGLFSPDRVPRVMVIDRDLALLNAIGEVFPWYHRQLCTCHIEKNILVHAVTARPRPASSLLVGSQRAQDAQSHVTQARPMLGPCHVHAALLHMYIAYPPPAPPSSRSLESSF